MAPTRIQSAVTWSALESSVRSAVQFAVGVVLARWLTPTEFGTYALLMVLIAFAGMLVEGGMSNALIHSRGRSHEDECTVFWFSLSSAMLVAVLVIFAGKWAASFFAMPMLAPLAWAAGAIVVFSALQCVPTALASKGLDFRSQAHASLVAVVLAGVLALYLAWSGAGVWALAWQAVATSGLQALVLWAKVRWRPSVLFRGASLRRLFRYGGFILVANLIDTLVSRLHLVLIGKLYSPADLGQFTRAATTRDGPQSVLSGMFTKVAFSVYSSEASEPAVLRKSLRRSIVAMMAVNLPVMAGLGVLAGLLIPVVFGPNWGRSIPLLQILCVAGALWPLQIANVQALLAQGRSQLLLRTEVIKKSVLVVLTVIASPFSIEAIAWALVFSSILAHAINTYYIGKTLGYGYVAQVKDVLPYVGLAMLMVLCVSIINIWLPVASPALRLLVLSGAGAGIYASALRLSGLEAWGLLRGFLPSGLSMSSRGA